ncbi:PQQ-binding-like beta-propeller repeat protein [Metabacillus fastidiosus]|uniref:outer membrane protein assembly factor BamB family protein n=1 Tax=Metabacillus fastidiosus TaxID=1458 RepID=UPI000825E6A7|nr:PQQ-binding-like beta-propeller repeat protein [Metabacillus fastidiosus]MED4461875.1 PQQ-binding-like beta-propeller repeat protein [Metabacillus fastidiosus]
MNGSIEETRQSRKKKRRRRKNLRPYFIIFTILFVFPASSIVGIVLWLTKEPPPKITVLKSEEFIKNHELTVHYENGTETAPFIKWILEDHHSSNDFNWFESYKGELGFFINRESLYIIEPETGQIKKKLAVKKSRHHEPPEDYKGLRFDGGSIIEARDRSLETVWSFVPKHESYLSWNGGIENDFKNGQVLVHGNFIMKGGLGHGKGGYAYASSVYALDAMTGKERWGFGVDGELMEFSKNPEKDEIYTVYSDIMMAFNTVTGSQEWVTPLTLGVEGFRANHDYVFISTGRGVFQVYDSANGRIKWEVAPPMDWGSSWDQLPAAWYDDTVAISAERSIIAYNIKDGKKKWSITFDSDRLGIENDEIPIFYDPPFVYGNSIYVKSENHGWFALDLPPI